MRELVLTRHNELIDPLLSVWRWQIPVYLFLGGWVAGMMIIAGYFLLRRGSAAWRAGADPAGGHGQGPGASLPDCVCGVLPALSVVLLSLGMFALFLDLEHKRYVWRLYTTFQPASPMSWGAWILLLVYPALGVLLLVHPPRLLTGLWPSFDRLSARLDSPRVVKAVAIANIALGVGLGIYTGVLLSALGARPFWNSSLLGVLFLASGLSSAAAFTHLVARHPDERALLARGDNVFLAVELLLIALFLVGLLNSSLAQREAALLVLGGPFAAVFWVVVVGLGIVVPLAIQGLAVSHRIRHTPVAAVFVLAGGLALRFVVVLAGQASRWPR